MCWHCHVSCDSIMKKINSRYFVIAQFDFARIYHIKRFVEKSHLPAIVMHHSKKFKQNIMEAKL